MSDYIRVLGPNPDYNGSKMYFFLHKSLVAKICPVWAEVKDGKAWLCTPTHPNAQVVSCTLVDHAGNEYSCGKVEELRKLLAEDDLCRLFGKEPEKKRFGFVHRKDKPDEQVDFTEPKRGSKEAVRPYLGIFQQDGDVEARLAELKALREGVPSEVGQ